jgi:hypothetical protein
MSEHHSIAAGFKDPAQRRLFGDHLVRAGLPEQGLGAPPEAE